MDLRVLTGVLILIISTSIQARGNEQDVACNNLSDHIATNVDTSNKSKLLAILEKKGINKLSTELCVVSQDSTSMHNEMRAKILNAMGIIKNEKSYSEKNFNKSQAQQLAVKDFFRAYSSSLMCNSPTKRSVRTPLSLLKRASEYLQFKSIYQLIMNRGKNKININQIEIIQENGKKVKETLLDYLYKLKTQIKVAYGAGNPKEKSLEKMIKNVIRIGGKKAKDLN